MDAPETLNGDAMSTSASLQCEITPGLFSDEYAVSGKLADGSGFSLFTELTDLSFEGEPQADQPVTGRIRVTVIKRVAGNVIVRLPKSTLENGQTIAVREDSVHEALERQDA